MGLDWIGLELLRGCLLFNRVVLRLVLRSMVDGVCMWIVNCGGFRGVWKSRRLSIYKRRR